jgi:hypothetical protein
LIAKQQLKAERLLKPDQNVTCVCIVLSLNVYEFYSGAVVRNPNNKIENRKKYLDQSKINLGPLTNQKAFKMFVHGKPKLVL